VKFGGFVVIAVRHLRFLKSSSQHATIHQTPGRSRMSRNGVAGCWLFHLNREPLVACFEWAWLPYEPHHRSALGIIR
jgi:hypothetical protein